MFICWLSRELIKCNRSPRSQSTRRGLSLGHGAAIEELRPDSLTVRPDRAHPSSRDRESFQQSKRWRTGSVQV